jgi:hypothetical protein
MNTSARLTSIDLDGQPTEWILDKKEHLIGREPPADILLPLARVSRQHARIIHEEHGYYVTDLVSSNGTYVNGNCLGPEPVRLKDNDEIVVGGVVALKFHDPGDTVQMPRLGRLRGVWVDEASCSAWVDAQPVEPPLSAAQFALLVLLHQRAGQVVSRAEIIAAVWPSTESTGVSDEAVEGLIKRLRRRLRETKPGTDYLTIVRGHGIRLMQPEA